MTKKDLSESKKRLVEMMQFLNFGRFEGLIISDGEPVIDPPPRIVREMKFCAENGARTEVSKKDYVLKSQVREFIAQMETIGTGTIITLEVKHGLPFRIFFLEDSA